MPLYQIGIDLGTTLMRVYRPRKGILFTEPTCVAFDTRREDDGIVAYGEDARKMVGREPDFIKVVFPMLNGVIADYRLCEHLMRRVLAKVCGGMLVKPALALCMPAGVTEVERMALESAALEAGARKFLLIEEPIAAALGAGVDMTKPHGRLVVDMGGGSTDSCVTSMCHTITRSSARVAGNALDEAIVRYLRNIRGMLVGRQTAEELKKKYGAASDPDPELVFPVKGRHVNGIPGTIEMRQSELTEAMREPLSEICEGISLALERVPPDLAADIMADGMCLTGGGALLHNIDRYFQQQIGLPVHIPEDPQNCVAVGTGLAFRYARQVQKQEKKRLRLKPKAAGVPELGMKRADEHDPIPRTRPDWFVRDEDKRPMWHGVPVLRPDDLLPDVLPPAESAPDAAVPEASSPRTPPSEARPDEAVPEPQSSPPSADPPAHTDGNT